MNSSAASRLPAWIDTREKKLVWAFAILLFALNLLTSDLYPTCWCDEPMFSDPAVNLAQGRGFVSTAWWLPANVTWSGNVPLYCLVLSVWLKIFGVGLVKARAFNYLTISAVALIFWAGVKRLGCVQSAAARVAMLVCIFLGYSLSTAFRSARPDCLGILICAGALWAWTLEKRSARFTCLFLAGFLMPISGLQLIGYFGLLCLLALFLLRGAAVAPLFAVGVGIIAGGLALFAYYYTNHLDGVLVTIRETRVNHELAVAARLGPHASALARGMELARRIFFDEIKDVGVTPYLAALAVLAIDRGVRSDADTRRWPLFGLIASVAMVSALELFLHYLDYYHWMNLMMLAVILFAVLSRTWNKMLPHTKALVLLFLAGSVAAGLPLRAGLGVVMQQHDEFTQLKQLIASEVKPADVVFTDYMGYFPVKQHALEVYCPPYFKVMTDAERERVNVVVVDANDVNQYSANFIRDPRQWKKVGGFVSQPGAIARWFFRRFPNFRKQPTNCGYAIAIFRRETSDLNSKPPAL